MAPHEQINCALKHIKEWAHHASLGDRRVILRKPLTGTDQILLERCRELGQIHQDQGRYLLERLW